MIIYFSRYYTLLVFCFSFCKWALPKKKVVKDNLSYSFYFQRRRIGMEFGVQKVIEVESDRGGPFVSVSVTCDARVIRKYERVVVVVGVIENTRRLCDRNKSSFMILACKSFIIQYECNMKYSQSNLREVFLFVYLYAYHWMGGFDDCFQRRET